MVKMHCQGYCGGMYPVDEMEIVGPAAERMCPDCAEEARTDE